MDCDSEEIILRYLKFDVSSLVVTPTPTVLNISIHLGLNYIQTCLPRLKHLPSDHCNNGFFEITFPAILFAMDGVATLLALDSRYGFSV